MEKGLLVHWETLSKIVTLAQTRLEFENHGFQDETEWLLAVCDQIKKVITEEKGHVVRISMVEDYE